MQHNSSNLTAPHSVVDAAEALQQISSDALPMGLSGPARFRRPAHGETFIGIVRTTPCSVEVMSDYTDARYFLNRAVPVTGTSSLLATAVDAFPGVGECLTATNLAELGAATHLLPAGTVVQVFALYTRQGIRRLVFDRVPIDAADGGTGDPIVLGDGAGGSVDPNSTAWNKTTDASPLDVWVQTRTVWDSTTGTLYGYLRKLSFDVRGKLAEVSGENQIRLFWKPSG